MQLLRSWIRAHQRADTSAELAWRLVFCALAAFWGGTTVWEEVETLLTCTAVADDRWCSIDKGLAWERAACVC